MEDKNYLQEAFKAFDTLTEEIFDISIEDGFQKAKEFKDDVVDDTEEVVVIDDTIEDEEEVETSYVGKAILQCPTCQSMVYRDPEEVIINEEEGLANIGDVCPTCQSDEGFKVIGEVTGFEAEECECKDGECTCKDKEEIKVDDIDSIDDEDDYFNGEDEEDLKESLPNNIKIVKTFKDKEDGRTHVIAHRPSDNTYIVGLGYDKEQDRWGQGVYDFGSMEDAIKYLKAKYEVGSSVKESLSRRKSLKEKESLTARRVRRAQKDPLDDIDADADDKKETAKKRFAKSKDDVDADRDYKLKRKGLKENISTVFENDDIRVTSTGHNFDFIATVENKTEEPILIDFYDTEESLRIEPSGYVGLLADKTGRIMLNQFKTNNFIVYVGDEDMTESCNTKKSSMPNKAKLKEAVKRWRTQKSLKEGSLKVEGTNVKNVLNKIEDYIGREVELDELDELKVIARKHRDYKMLGLIKQAQDLQKDKKSDDYKESIKSRRRVRLSKEDKMNEDFNKVDIETDREKLTMSSDENGKVTVTTEPLNQEPKMDKDGEEMIAPVSDELKAKFKTEQPEKDENKEEYIDVDFDEFEEKDFDSLGEGYLKRVYENVAGFSTTKGTVAGNKLKLEGIIKFKSGKEGKTTFVFEAHSMSKTGKLKFFGENSQFAQGKKSFTLTGRAENGKLCCESLHYNYRVRDGNGDAQRIHGTVSKDAKKTLV